MVIGLNIGVLGLFSLESVTMAELFGSRTRFTQLALAKEIGGILATAIGPVRRRDPHSRDRQLVADRRDARRLLADHPRVRRARARDPRARPGPAGGRGMKAVSSTEPATCGSTSGPTRSPGAGEVLIAMEWGGVCGSDLAYWRHGASGTAVLRQPLVLGHEVAGRIAAVGAGVDRLRGRAAGHRPPGRAGRRRVPARADRRPHQPLPADPLLRLGGVRPAHRRRVQRTAGGARRPDPPAARRA